jgi:hypothetical protein
MAAATMGGRIGGIEPPPLVALQGQYQPLAATVNRRRRKPGNGVTIPRIIRLTPDDVDAAPGARPICSAVAPSAVSSSGGIATIVPASDYVSKFRGEGVEPDLVALAVADHVLTFRGDGLGTATSLPADGNQGFKVWR